MMKPKLASILLVLRQSQIFRSALVAALLLLCQQAFCAPILRRETAGLSLQSPSGTLRLQVCADKIIRVLYSPSNSPAPNLDCVVTAHWPKTKFAVEEKGNAVWLRTKALSIRLEKTEGTLTFFDNAGNVLLAETPGAKKLTPDGDYFVAEDSFSSPPDESLYGLGQYQEGLWNWRGLPREFRQHNMTATIPMLVSSRGYGLLWDNASVTEFNPIDTEVPLTSAHDSTNPNRRGPKIFTWTGTFTNGAAGEYVFFARADNNRQDFSIAVDGQEIAGISNYWTPFTLCGVADFPANQTHRIVVRGGNHVKLFAAPRANTTTFRSHLAKSIDYLFFYGPELDEVVRGYRQATGDAPLWPEWAYGFWQCRERYSSQHQLLDAAAEFRRRHIPLDLIVQDWKYWGTNGWGSYEWDLKNYPDPAAMIQTLHDEHVKFMISVWCNPHGKTLADLSSHHANIGEWIDVFNPLGRKIRWQHLNDAFFKIGTDAWWGDATEPGDTGDAMDGAKTFLGPGDFYHNAYSLFASQSIYDEERAADSSKRVCILTRNAFPGLQRYASAIWSGDISGNWITFRRQIPAGLNFCLTGIPYWTTDCGGFWHPANQYTSPDYNELLSRWFEWSAFCPILRIHGGATATEVWNWLPETQKILTSYDNLRHRLLPYNYSVAWQVTSAQYTIMRALAMDFRADTNALAISDEYMFGPAFLVAPVTEPQTSFKKVYLPAGTRWIDFWTGEKLAGAQTVNTAAPLEQIPLFVRAGSIVPFGPVVQFAGEKPQAPIELRVYPGADGAFTLYEDEGDSYRYENGARAMIPLRWNDRDQTLTFGAREGSFHGMVKDRLFRIVLVRPNHGVGPSEATTPDREVHYRGKKLAVRFQQP
ncbi:MAG TPA: glycoside hydrolase family 31 protein [Candidatus Angelobacter sp.]|nr:glycoside hydrolase family 31 protein [Candidatus Angelobacter sp.]